MKKHMISALILCSLLTTSSVTAFAVDSRITDSGHNTIQTSSGAIYASGYTTSTTKHYTTARLFCSDGQERTSERNWGTGTVYAHSDSMPYDSDYQYGSAVYYGF